HFAEPTQLESEPTPADRGARPGGHSAPVWSKWFKCAVRSVSGQGAGPQMGERVPVHVAWIIIGMQSFRRACVTHRLDKSCNRGRLKTCRQRIRAPVVALEQGQVETGVDVLPRSGDVLRVTRAASVQFSTPMLFRVIRVHDWSTYNGWAWLDGYELNGVGDAVER